MKRMKCSLICALLCVLWHFVAQASMTADPSPTDWDYFVYTQQWPTGACIDANNSGHTCKIPDNTTTWTVHGLWPNKNNTEGPSYCNKSAKFDISQVQLLEGKLIKFWPNLYADSSLSSFWKHEWEKHGTCAASLPVVSGEYNYFAMGLQLNRKYDLLSLLVAHGVTPDSTKQYSASVLETAVQDAIQKHALVRCTYDQATKSHHLMEVEMCLDKGLAPIDCPRPQGLHAPELCPVTKPIHYAPIREDAVTGTQKQKMKKKLARAEKLDAAVVEGVRKRMTEKMLKEKAQHGGQ